MRYPIEKYKFVIEDGKVVAKSTYAGNEVTGSASCDPLDTFDEEVGKKLAAYRCNAKVARKRMLRANEKAREAFETLSIVLNNFKKACKYQRDATVEFNLANKQVRDLELRLKGIRK